MVMHYPRFLYRYYGLLRDMLDIERQGSGGDDVSK
jgi:hypothetical protein